MISNWIPGVPGFVIKPGAPGPGFCYQGCGDHG